MLWFFHLPEFWKLLLSSLIALLTLAGIMTRPFRWNEARIAMGGAGVLLLLGLITPANALFTLIRDWNTFLFFLGMMALSALAETAGLFDWLGIQAARFAGKSAARLFLNVFLLGTLISMLFSNDATMHPHAPPPGPLHHPPPPPPHHPREEEMSEAEKATAQEVLNEGCRHFTGAERLEREGRPKLEIVNVAAEWRADLVVVCSRAAYQKRREIGPQSVGHVARFVLDHAPCPVLLLRPLGRELFPIER